MDLLFDVTEMETERSLSYAPTVGGIKWPTGEDFHLSTRRDSQDNIIGVEFRAPTSRDPVLRAKRGLGSIKREWVAYVQKGLEKTKGDDPVGLTRVQEPWSGTHYTNLQNLRYDRLR